MFIFMIDIFITKSFKFIGKKLIEEVIKNVKLWKQSLKKQWLVQLELLGPRVHEIFDKKKLTSFKLL